MKSGTRDERQAARLLEQLGYSAMGVGHRHGLTAAQWGALRFFGRANRFSRTISSFAEFHVTTRGTASQTVGRLVELGFLRRKRSTIDGRSVQLDLTRKGRRVLADDPVEELVDSLRSLAPGTRARFVHTLQRLVADVARSRGSPMFGTCSTCSYLEGDRRIEAGASFGWCNLFDEPADEADQLCANYTPAG